MNFSEKPVPCGRTWKLLIIILQNNEPVRKDGREVMKRKVLAVVLCGAMITGLFTGCGGGAEENKGESAGASDGTSGSITVWEHDYSYEESLVQVIEAFNEQYPDIEVNYEIRADGDYYSLLSTAIQSGDGPDLFWTNGTATVNMPDYVANDAVADLTDKVDFSFFDDSAMALSEIDGKYYSVPWMTLDTRTVFYNKDMFEEHGWEIPATFSEFEDLLAQIKAEGITPISMALDSWSLLFGFEPILAGYDPDYSAALQDYKDITVTDQPVRECMQLMVDWANKGYFGDNWQGVIDNASQILAFTSGNTAMNIAGSWDAATISSNNPDLNYGAFSIPSEDGTCGLVGSAANGFSVNAASSDMEAAITFANFCATEEAQTIWVQSQGAVPATDSIEASTEIAQEISDSGQGNLYRSWQNVLSSYSSTGDASTIWGNDFTKIFTGEMTVDELCDEIQNEM